MQTRPGGITLLIILAVLLLPSSTAARASFAKPVYLDSIFNQNPQPSRPAGSVPEPQASRVQVFIYKKGTVLWTQKANLLPALVAGTPGRRGLIQLNDPRLAKIIAKYARQQGLDPRLIQTVIRHESGFDPVAVSPKGAMGLMQLMPETAASLGVEDPFDVEQNIRGGSRFLKICLNRFNQNLPLALAAYNAGPGRVAEHQGVPPIKETQEYVKKVVLDYNGQTLDLAQVKLQPSDSAPTEPSAAPAAPPAAAPPPQLQLPGLMQSLLDIPPGLIIP